MIPSLWETKRLTMEDLIKEDIQTVQKLYEQGSFVHHWEGGSIDEEYAYRCFTDGDLPPEGTKDQYRIQVIRMKESGHIVGLLTTYHGYPTPETFYINYLYIDRESHNQVLGQEVIYELLDILKRIEYDEVRANVAIKIGQPLGFGQKLDLIPYMGFMETKNTLLIITLTWS